jgi:hypothetical protein
MVKQVIRLTLAAAALGLMASPADAQQKVPVQFARGASSATVKGSISGNEFRDYTVNARAGQTMSVTLKPSNGYTYFNILAPGDTEVAFFTSDTGGNSFRGTLAKSGVHTIRVYQLREARRRGLTATYTLMVGVTGGASAATAAPARRPGDAIDPRTGYNATTQIRCGRAEGALNQMCQAGVKRYADGTASVHLRTPQDGSRTIWFRNTIITRTDGGEFDVRRVGDTNFVSVAGIEFYEIPDALPIGG